MLSNVTITNAISSQPTSSRTPSILLKKIQVLLNEDKMPSNEALGIALNVVGTKTITLKICPPSNFQTVEKAVYPIDHEQFAQIEKAIVDRNVTVLVSILTSMQDSKISKFTFPVNLSEVELKIHPDHPLNVSPTATPPQSTIAIHASETPKAVASQLATGTITQPNGTYVGEILDGKKHGKGTFTSKNGEQVLEGTFRDGKAINGILRFDTGEIDFSIIENGVGKTGSNITYRPKVVTNIVEISGIFTGSLGHPINISEDFEAIILIDGEKCKYKKNGEIVIEGKIFQMGQLLTADGCKVYDGRFVNNKPVCQGINVKPTEKKVTVMDKDGKISEVNVRMFANNHGYCHAPTSLRSTEANIAAETIFPVVKEPEDYFIIKLTDCGLGAFAKVLIPKGTAFYYTGIFVSKNDKSTNVTNVDPYLFGAESRDWNISASSYGNLTRFIQSGVSPKNVQEASARVKKYMEPPNFYAMDLAGEEDHVVLVSIRDILPGEILLFDYFKGLRFLKEKMFFDRLGRAFAISRDVEVIRDGKPAIASQIFVREEFNENMDAKLVPASLLPDAEAYRCSGFVAAISCVYKLIIRYAKLFSTKKTPNCYRCKDSDIYRLHFAEQIQLLRNIAQEIKTVKTMIKLTDDIEIFMQLEHKFLFFANGIQDPETILKLVELKEIDPVAAQEMADRLMGQEL